MSLDSRRSGFNRLNAPNNNVYTITAHPGLLHPDQNEEQSPQEVEISYTDLRTIGNGSFGVVFQATLQRPTQEQIAIKKVLQDKRFKNRELQIMRKLDHCNVVKLKYFFHTMGDRGSSEVYLHLVLEYIPETLYKIARNHSRSRRNLPMILVKLYMYQLFRSLNYIHSMDICHRDIKPQNLLLNPETGVLKLCDFGSAKSLVGGEPNVAYICSRYYRAPELIFGATDYTTKIDIWSAGCVMAELILGEPMFPGESGVDQLVEIIKVLGTPTREQMRAMNPNYTEFRFPVIRARSWNRIFSSHLNAPPEAAKLVSNLLEYTPTNRLTPLDACAHPFFDELRSPSTRLLPNGQPYPPLFNFSDEELRKEPHLAARLIPSNFSDHNQLSQQQHQNRSNPSAGAASSTTTITSTSTTNTNTCNNTTLPSSAPTQPSPSSSNPCAGTTNTNATASNAATNAVGASSSSSKAAAAAPSITSNNTDCSSNNPNNKQQATTNTDDTTGDHNPNAATGTALNGSPNSTSQSGNTNRASDVGGGGNVSINDRGPGNSGSSSETNRQA